MILITTYDQVVMAFIDPFSPGFMRDALLGGALAAVICGVVGTWVVIRGMAFLGEAIGHGMLPGVAIATIIGAPAIVGGAVSAAAMSALISVLRKRGRLSHDTSIGLLFVAMLATGVIIVSHSASFATDATALLFGDVLAIQSDVLIVLLIAVLVTVAVAAVMHRRFVAAAFDPRIAQTLGLRPETSQAVLVGLVSLAVVSSFQAVGTLLVVALLLAPAVAAAPWTTRIPHQMVLASAFGGGAVYLGLISSWYVGTAAGASIALCAIVLAAVSHLCARLIVAVTARGSARPPQPSMAAVTE